MDTVVLGLRVLLALACVIGLIWVLARRAGWGKGRRRPAGPAVEVVGRQALGRHAGVVVVAVGERRLLLGYGEQNVTMLTELDAVADEETAEDGADAPAAPAPLTLGALAAAVLPTPRRARGAVAVPQATAADTTAPVADAAPAFEDALAAATAASSASAAASAAALAAASSASGPGAAVPGLVGLEVADVDPARIERLAAPAAGAPQAAPHGALHGSVLAPSTWKQAVAVLRERTVRR
ncbi:flagellar biosynthetic protein FliO [Cellulomonas sp. ACRRI]|uniref:flagellar biosynthetic protein FliO n=1 Tax=Cellulomonas sp. ACRRI TaxID=2918188 RepID=UPI001EF333B3|nr:flagellar biosynthetic protein FliO [Cellulomonas sp. ACRRI]MCG7287184.1 flagellar biosynthetic protein FliO [Cellulomonas sp. ACRRI]